MSTEYYLTLKRADNGRITGEKDVFIIEGKELAQTILATLNHANPNKYLMIDVKEPFKDGKKVKRRSVDLNLFVSLNEVEDTNKKINFKIFIPPVNIQFKEIYNFLAFLKQHNIAGADENEILQLEKEFTFCVYEIVEKQKIHIRKYEKCKVIEKTEKRDFIPVGEFGNIYPVIFIPDAKHLENITLSYETYNEYFSSIETIKDDQKYVLEYGNIENKSDFVWIEINGNVLPFVQELEIGDYKIKVEKYSQYRYIEKD